jgi:predicted nucleic acid-binding protein
MWVLDTDVVSHLRRPQRTDPKVAAWAGRQSVASFFISVITLLEIERATQLMERKDSAQGKVLRAWLDDQLLPHFSQRTLPIDPDIAKCCARLHVPDPRPERDAFIAATAIVHGLTVVTRNVTDFENTGAPILNPWE